MVAHDVAGARALAGGGDAKQVDEALVALGVLGAHRGGQHGMEGAEQVRGVHHAVLRVTGVDGVSLERDGDLAGVEALPFELADGPAVDGVGERAAERLQVEEGGAVADLLVRAEADAQARVRQLRVRRQARDEPHDLGDARLVVGTQERRAVGADEVLAHEPVEHGELVGADGDEGARMLAADEVPARVAHDVRLHAAAGRRFRGVDVRDEPEGGQVLRAGARRDARGHVGMLGDLDVLGAQFAQLVCEHMREVELLRGRGGLVGMGVARRRVDLHVAQEALEDVGGGALVCHDDAPFLGGVEPDRPSRRSHGSTLARALARRAEPRRARPARGTAAPCATPVQRGRAAGHWGTIVRKSRRWERFMDTTAASQELHLTMSNEDYLECLVRIEEEGKATDGMRSVDVATRLGVSKASVNKAITALKAQGLVEQSHYGKITLTDQGREIGSAVWSRHRLLRAFLTEELGVDFDRADAEACKMEHALSEDTMERWLSYLQRQGIAFEGDRS